MNDFTKMVLIAIVIALPISYFIAKSWLNGFAKFLDGTRQFHNRLEEHNIDHIYKEVNSGHTGDSWDQRIDDILIQFFGE